MAINLLLALGIALGSAGLLLLVLYVVLKIVVPKAFEQKIQTPVQIMDMPVKPGIVIEPNVLIETNVLLPPFGDLRISKIAVSELTQETLSSFINPHSGETRTQQTKSSQASPEGLIH